MRVKRTDFHLPTAEHSSQPVIARLGAKKLSKFRHLPSSTFHLPRLWRSLTATRRRRVASGALSMVIVAGIILQALPAGAAPATVRQEINIINKTYTATNATLTSDEIVQLDTTAYSGTVTYYFEVVANTTASSTGNIALRRSGTSTNDATIALSTVGTSYTRYRTSAFTAPAGQTQYVLYADAAGAAKTLNIKAARIIISQTSDPITATETQIEIGNHETGKNNTTAAPLNNPKYWKYTAANWNPAPTFYAEVTYKATIGTAPVSDTYPGTSGTSNYSVTIPSGVNQVTVDAWGPGGTGGSQGSTSGASGGGGGGAYAKGTVSVSPGEYWAVVAATGNNGNSFFGPTQSSVNALVLAAGGASGSASNAGGGGGAGGTTAASIGNIITRAGGMGANGQASTGGGGGGGAGTNNPGGNSTTVTGGTGGTVDGGNGGGGASNSNGMAGSNFGGGGGGSHRTNGNRSGGSGGGGKVVVSYEQPAVGHSVTVNLQEDDGNFGNWTNVTNGTVVSNGVDNSSTRVRTNSGFTPVEGRNYRIATSITNSASNYEIYSSKVVAKYNSIKEVQPTGNITRDWSVSEMSSDGLIIFSGADPGRLYRSVNGGNTWSEVQPAGNIEASWRYMALSPNGQYVIVANAFGRLYLSNNSGASWAETQPLGNTDQWWGDIAINSDGTKIIVGTSSGRLYLSSNGGSSWTETQPAGNVSFQWYAQSMSHDGMIIAASAYGGRLYISNDGGSSWAETQPAGNVNQQWWDISMSSSGSNIIAIGGSGRVYLSTNTGSNWTEAQPAGSADLSWSDSAISHDGQIMALVLGGGRLYRSINSGVNWTEIQPEGNINRNWRSVSMNGDGTTVLASYSNGRVYIASDFRKTEFQYLIGNTSIGGSTGLKDYDTRWDPAEWSNVNNTYYHEVNGATSGTAGAKLQSNPNVTPVDVTNSAIANAVEVSRSTALTMPGSATDIDVNVTATGTLNASRIIVVVDTNTNTAPTTPTLSAPANSATGVSTTPTFQLSSTDTESDYLRYRIEVCTTSNCGVVLRTIDQTSSQTGWSGQNTQTSTAYTSGTTASHTYQAPALTNNTQYWWRASARDPGGSNTWSTVSSINSFTTVAANAAPAAPTLSSPTNTASSVSINPAFQLVATDTDSDYLRYRIEVCTTSDCTVVLRTIDQTSSQTGWSGQNTQTNTAYTSGTSATHSYQAPSLSYSTQYWWRASAIDSGGSNTWSTVSSINTFTTGAMPTGSATEIRGGTTIQGGTQIGQ